MSQILRMGTVIVMLAFAATGVAQARPMNYRNDHLRPGYAHTVYSQAPCETGRGGAGLVCDMPSSLCSNDERIND